MCSLFIQSKIVDGKFKIDGSNEATNALTIAGEIIPEVGSVLTQIAQVMEYKNELVIKEKLSKISVMIRDDMKNLVAKYIASKLVIKRRAYLTNLTSEDIRCSVTNYDKIKLIFDDSSLHVLKAQMDLKIIEAYILALDEKLIQIAYMKSNFAEIFADIIVKEFMGDVKLKFVDAPLKEGEKPDHFQVEKKLMVLDEYFNHEKYALPPLLKKL